MLQIKIMETKQRTPYKQLFSYTPSIPGWVTRSTLFEGGHNAYQIERNEVKNIMHYDDCTLLIFWVGLKGQILKLCRKVYFDRT